MNRHNWARTVSVTLLLVAALTSCGGGSPASAASKRLSDQGPCDLAKVDDLEKIFGPVNNDHPPKQEGPQCFYRFENGDPAIGRRADAARHGTSFDIDGVAAKKYEANGTCAVDVWLVPDDLNQQFGVVSIGEVGDQGPCDVSVAVARLILKNLPG